MKNLVRKLRLAPVTVNASVMPSYVVFVSHELRRNNGLLLEVLTYLRSFGSVRADAPCRY